MFIGTHWSLYCALDVSRLCDGFRHQLQLLMASMLQINSHNRMLPRSLTDFTSYTCSSYVSEHHIAHPLHSLLEHNTTFSNCLLKSTTLFLFSSDARPPPMDPVDTATEFSQAHFSRDDDLLSLQIEPHW